MAATQAEARGAGGGAGVLGPVVGAVTCAPVDVHPLLVQLRALGWVAGRVTPYHATTEAAAEAGAGAAVLRAIHLTAGGAAALSGAVAALAAVAAGEVRDPRAPVSLLQLPPACLAKLPDKLSAALSAAKRGDYLCWCPGLRAMSGRCEGPIPVPMPAYPPAEGTADTSTRPAKRRRVQAPSAEVAAEAAEAAEEAVASFQFAELFAGIGGFSLALESLGGECVFASEIDTEARRVYGRHFGQLPYGDVTEIETGDVPGFSILTGGFPCQSFSAAGEQKALGDVRGQLFYEVVRFLTDKQPAAFLLENVANLQAVHDGAAFRIVLEQLAGCGYHVTFAVINARAVVPQQRERLYFAGFRDRAARDRFQWPAFPVLERCVGEILEPEEALRAQGLELTPHQWGKLQASKHLDLKLVDPAGAASTMMAGYKRSYAHFSQFVPAARHDGPAGQERARPRFFTAREVARLQAFPETYSFAENSVQNRAYHQLGNAVCPPVVANLALAVLQACGIVTTGRAVDGLPPPWALLLSSMPEGAARTALQAQLLAFEAPGRGGPPAYHGRTEQLHVPDIQHLLEQGGRSPLRLGLHCLRSYITPSLVGTERAAQNSIQLLGKGIVPRLLDLLTASTDEIAKLAKSVLSRLVQGPPRLVDELMEHDGLARMEAACTPDQDGTVQRTLQMRLAALKAAFAEAGRHGFSRREQADEARSHTECTT